MSFIQELNQHAIDNYEHIEKSPELLKFIEKIKKLCLTHSRTRKVKMIFSYDGHNPIELWGNQNLHYYIQNILGLKLKTKFAYVHRPDSLPSLNLKDKEYSWTISW